MKTRKTQERGTREKGQFTESQKELVDRFVRETAVAACSRAATAGNAIVRILVATLWRVYSIENTKMEGRAPIGRAAPTTMKTKRKRSNTKTKSQLTEIQKKFIHQFTKHMSLA